MPNCAILYKNNSPIFVGKNYKIMLKTLFIFVTIIHGLIHFLGFSKAFGYGNVTQLTKEISKPMGILWLITAFLFLFCMILYIFKKDNWVYFAFVAVVFSQILVINSWQDAKFGTIINLLVLVIAIIGLFQIKFKSEYKKEVKIGLAESNNQPNKILTDAEIAHLPELVQKYIRYTGCMNKQIVHHFKIDFEGKIRSHEKKVWMYLVSEQFNFIKTPTRLFYLDATMNDLPVAGFHCFKNGVAFMDIRLLSMFKVQYAAGKEMDISETVTFFNDMCCMAPATLIDKRIKWLGAEGNKVKASFSNNNITISAELYFNEKGELINFISEDRSVLEEDGTTQKRKWSTPLRDYKDINGYKLASYAETVYTYPDGDFIYATFTLKNIRYNGILNILS